MFTYPRPWTKVLKTSEPHRRRSPLRTKTHSSPPRLEELEARTLLNAGDLDPTFGTGGKTVATFVGAINATAQATIVQPDGKIVVAGSDYNGSSAADLLLARYNLDGSLDTGFGSGGKVNSEFFVTGVRRLALQGDGKLVVIGSASNGFEVVRYNPDGSLDTAFGSGGRAITTFDSTQLFQITVHDGVLQPDGKVLVVGAAYVSRSASYELLMTRYQTDGSPDVSFGTTGTVTRNTAIFAAVAVQSDSRIVFAGASGITRYNADGSLDASFGQGGTASVDFAPGRVVLQADGKIVVMGNRYQAGSSPQYPEVIARFNPDGRLDAGFGNAGEVVTVLAAYTPDADGLVVQQDGKIIVSGASGGNLAVARYGADGSVDASFGSGGKVIDSRAFNITYSSDVALEPDQRIVLMVAAGGFPGFLTFGLARYNPDGSVDATFGSNGSLTTGFVGTVGSLANYVVMQPGGKILVGGTVTGAADGVLLRYNPDGTLDPGFGTGGKASVIKNQSFALQRDGRIIVAGALLKRYNTDGSPDPAFMTEVLPEYIGTLTIQPDDKTLIRSASGLQRFNADGSLDFSFGVGGTMAITSSTALLPPGAVVQPDGKYVVGGPSLERFNADGSLDTFFGTDGFAVVTPVNSNINQQVQVALLPDTRIAALVFGGLGPNVNPPQLFVFRASGNPDFAFGTGGQITLNFYADFFAIQADGRIVIAGSAKDNNGLSSFAVARYLSTGSSTLTPNERYVSQLYLDILKRRVDSFGLAFWSGLLDQGKSRAQVAAGIEGGLEHLNMLVKDLYRLVLKRDPDSSGQATWVNFLGQGGTAAQLEATLLGSDEFFALYGNHPDQAFLQMLYQIVLNRPIDFAGSQSWGQALQSGTMSRAAVAAAVLGSVEANGMEVQTLYRHLLHRAADPDGLNTYIGLLQKGSSAEQLMVFFLTSSEYVSQV